MGFFDILGGIAKEVINNSVGGSASLKDAYLGLAPYCQDKLDPFCTFILEYASLSTVKKWRIYASLHYMAMPKVRKN
jgi:hypothetical protein